MLDCNWEMQNLGLWNWEILQNTAIEGERLIRGGTLPA